MSLLNKLFSIKENGFHYIIRFFGIKFKIRSLGLTNKEIRLVKNQIRPDLFEFSKKFIWSNEDKLSYKGKKWLLETMFYEKLGYFPNLKNPKSFNEKLNWMKLNYDNPIQKRCVDKYEFKEYIKEKLGEGYTIPLIGVYDSVNDIDFNNLPNQFVIKTTVNGGAHSVQIVRDKSSLDIDKLKYKFNNLLQDLETVYYAHLTKAYEGLKPRIIIEEYMEQITGQLYDYKFFCFHGDPKFVYVATDHFPGMVSKISLYDLNWKKLPIKYGAHSNKATVNMPKCLNEMIKLSKILSKDFPIVRVDFYEVENKLYVGELTFTPGSGFGKYMPADWDYKIGKWLDLNKLEDNYLIKEVL